MIIRASLMTAVALCGANATVATAGPLNCQWAEKSQCDPTKGCKPITITTYAKFNRLAKIYERCDRRGCDSYTANVSVVENGFTKIDVTGRGMFVNLAPDGVATEVVSLGNMILVSQGICK
jgi:hypothetical protein